MAPNCFELNWLIFFEDKTKTGICGNNNGIESLFTHVFKELIKMFISKKQ